MVDVRNRLELRVDPGSTVLPGSKGMLSSQTLAQVI